MLDGRCRQACPQYLGRLASATTDNERMPLARMLARVIQESGEQGVDIGERVGGMGGLEVAPLLSQRGARDGQAPDLAKVDPLGTKHFVREAKRAASQSTW